MDKLSYGWYPLRLQSPPHIRVSVLAAAHVREAKERTVTNKVILRAERWGRFNEDIDEIVALQLKATPTIYS